MSHKASLQVWRGDASAGALAGFQVEVSEGESSRRLGQLRQGPADPVLRARPVRRALAGSGCSRPTWSGSYGNRFVTMAILADLPFCSRTVGLPVLARLHLPGKGQGPGKVEMAAALGGPVRIGQPPI